MRKVFIITTLASADLSVVCIVIQEKMYVGKGRATVIAEVHHDVDEVLTVTNGEQTKKSKSRMVLWR